MLKSLFLFLTIVLSLSLSAFANDTISVADADGLNMQCVITGDNTAKVVEFDSNNTWIFPEEIEIDGKSYRITEISSSKTACVNKAVFPKYIEKISMPFLTDILLYMQCSNPPVLDLCSSAAKDIDAEVIVPAGTEDVYSKADEWKTLIKSIESAPISVTNNDITYNIDYTIDSRSNFSRAYLKVLGISTKGVSALDVPSSFEINGASHNVVEIGDSAFENNKNLESVVLPVTLKSIGSMAFAGCSSLKTLQLKSKNPPTLGDNVFYGVGTGIDLIVPSASVSKYEADEAWAAALEQTSGVKDSKETRSIVFVYSVNGMRLDKNMSSLYKGVRIVVYDNGDVEKIR